MQVKNSISFINQHVFQNYFFPLLICIVLFFPLVPLLSSFWLLFTVKTFYIVILNIAVISVRGKIHYILATVILALMLCTSTWLSYIFVSKYLIVAGNICAITFYTLVSIPIINYVFRQKIITGNIICGAIVVFFLFGLIWAEAFTCLEIIQPGSFSLSQDQAIAEIVNQDRIIYVRQYFTYFSLSTLTTLGYGDITPLTEYARYLAVLEAILGQIYMVVLVARLVGMHISQSQNTD